MDVETPDPPTLHGPDDRDDYDSFESDVDDETTDDGRRTELADVLAAGAWADAFDEWVSHTYLSAADVTVLAEAGVFGGLDLRWNPGSGDVGYRVPELPAAVAADCPDSAPDEVESELDSLARTVAETLETEYLVDDDRGFFADSDDREPDDG